MFRSIMAAALAVALLAGAARGDGITCDRGAYLGALIDDATACSLWTFPTAPATARRT